jgi:hypothetical protein
MRLRHWFSAFPLTGALALGCTPSIVIDAPDIEVTQPDLQFPATPANVAPGTTASAIYTLNTSRLGAAGSPDAGTYKSIQRLQVTRVALNAKTGIEDFSFLNHLTVTATNPASTYLPNPPVVPIVDYQASDVAAGASLALPVDPPVDMLPLWASTRLRLTITAAGNLPTVAWTADVVFSLSLRMTQ